MGERCNVPPPGWTCSREPGHDGPCAASPVANEPLSPLALVFSLTFLGALGALAASIWVHLIVLLFRWGWGLV